jgi:choline dehydrogenase-like flavoprotein
VFGRGQGAVGAHVSKEDFMLNRMMKEQGAAPTWIFERKDINSAIIALIDDLTEVWETAKRRTGLPADDSRATQQALLAPTWKGRVEAAVDEVDKINRRIRDYNLSCPAPCCRMIVRLERELGRVVYDDPAAGSKLKLKL